MRKIFYALFALLFVGCSVFDSELTVTDNGFEVATDVVWSADYMAYTLNVHLQTGEDGKYKVNYVIDGDHSLKLFSDKDKEYLSGTESTLSKNTATTFILPTLVGGEVHTMSIEFEKGGINRSYDIVLPDTSQKAVGVQVDSKTSLDFSRIILRNLMGPSVTNYTVSFSLDGNPLKDIKYMSNTFGGSMTIDFARSESYTFELPYIIAGSHIITVHVKSEMGSETTSVAFTEPQRRQTDLKFSYNHYTGNLMISSDYNPLKTEFDISIGIEVKGKNTYRHKLFFGVADPETIYHSDKVESFISIIPGITPKAIDNGMLKTLMDKIHNVQRDDASNAIGNGNSRKLGSYIYEVSLKFTIHSKGDYAGETFVTISPLTSAELPILYQYAIETWYSAKGSTKTIYPLFSVNDTTPANIRKL